MVKFSNYIFLFTFFVVNILISPQQKEINQQKKELEDLKKQINNLEIEIRSTDIKEKKNYEQLEYFNKQNFLINKLINNYRLEVKKKDTVIASLKRDIYTLESYTKKLQENYANFIVAVYKGIYKDDMIYLLDSKSMQEGLLRYKYLQKFSDDRKKNLAIIKENKERLYTARIDVENQKQEQTFLIADKEKEESLLKSKLNEKKLFIAKIKNDKEVLKKELDAKRRAENEIKNLISKLIAREEERKTEEKKRLELLKQKQKTNITNKEKVVEKTKNEEDLSFPQNFYSTYDLKSFAVLRGNMGWPVGNGSIIRKFGENTNTKLNTVTINYGIDIKVSGNLSVKSVGDGIVSAIEWLPGYGSVIIITHRDNYRTVFGHLSEIFVKEGDKVSAGSVIGNIGESLEGYILHFEIWNQRNFQNPELWLAKR